MSKMNILDLISFGSDDFTIQLGKIIENNNRYQTAEDIFYKHLESLRNTDFEYMTKIEDSVITMQDVARDAAFNEGFKLGIRLILGCCDSGKGEFGV